MIRLFAAVAIPHAIGVSLALAQNGLPGAQWHPPDKLHITLRFFGPVPENQADDLDSELARVGGDAFDLTLAGVGEFGAAGRSNAVWAGIAENPALRRLAARCETAARRAGLTADKRAWRPHVRLAHRGGAEPARVAAWIQDHNLLKSASFRVEAFGLYSSWRTDGGQTYQLEGRYSLARAAA